MRRIHFDSTDSTNTQALELWSRQEFDATPHQMPEPLLITATEQTSGRGRRGRTWHSPPGGAWMSIAWPMGRDASWYVGVSLSAALAVRQGILDAIGGQCPAAIEIKWPNDLLIDDSKVAGILCEQFTIPRRRAVDSPAGDNPSTTSAVLIIGVGINVDFELDRLGPPRELRHPPTTLAAALGRPIDVEQVVGAVRDSLSDSLRAYERQGLTGAAIEQLRQHLAYIGTHRSWNSPRGTMTGIIRGIDDAGRLVLDTEAGVVACEVGEFVADGPAVNDE